jgi:hypothetical protein
MNVQATSVVDLSGNALDVLESIHKKTRNHLTILAVVLGLLIVASTILITAGTVSEGRRHRHHLTMTAMKGGHPENDRPTQSHRRKKQEEAFADSQDSDGWLFTNPHC